MKDRMSIWALVCKALGWCCVLGGVISAFFTAGVTLFLIPIVVVLLLICAIFEWMDGITSQLIESREAQAKQIDLLDRIEERMSRVEKNTSVKEQQNNEETVTGRRRAQRQTETEVVEQAQHGFDPQNVADIYRLSQNPEK